MQMKKNITIVGAGLCGSLLAIRLAQRGYKVQLFERRSDMRKSEMYAGRSINLALSDRGIRALKMIGMDQFMLSESIPMEGRMIHSVDGNLSMQPYSGRPGEFINSISRGGLNIGLLNKAAEYPNIEMFFEAESTGANLNKGTVQFKLADGSIANVEDSIVFGTDGAGSAIRQSMMSDAGRLRFNFSLDFLSAGYKELHIPPSKLGEHLIEKNSLHIWPRNKFMMIGLPNLDGSFTMTVFQDFEGEEGFNSLDTDDKIHTFFSKHFADALALMPDLVNDFKTNPTGSLGTVRCYPWQVDGKFVLLGDAAHAIVPFYGQGMNCAFEDVVILDNLLDEMGDNWEGVLDAFQKSRKPNADAIADLAIFNFIEMRDLVADPIFVKKRQLETKLEAHHPDYFSKYSMVTFREDLPYSEAKRRGDFQNEFLMELCTNTDDISTLDTATVLKDLKSWMELKDII